MITFKEWARTRAKMENIQQQQYAANTYDDPKVIRQALIELNKIKSMLYQWKQQFGQIIPEEWGLNNAANALSQLASSIQSKFNNFPQHVMKQHFDKNPYDGLQGS